MKIRSSEFENEGEIPSKYTCEGEDINPPLTISDIPGKAESLAIIMDDPDAVKPTGQVWDHWIVFNIPAENISLEEGEEPEGTHGEGTSENLKYKGPCPPDREHTYHFKLYALDTKLDLSEGSTKEEVEEAMEDHIIEEAELLGRYDKNER